jgi:tetratricopeptide (TPR) repeat protein
MSESDSPRKAHIGRFLILAGAFVLLSLNSYSQNYIYSENCRKAWESILNFEFGQARLALDAEKKAHPQNLFPVYCENYIDFLVLFTGEDQSAFNVLKNRKSERIEILEKGDQNSPYYRYFLANIYLQWGFTRIKFGEYATAALELRKAYELLKENQKMFPDFVPNSLALGLLHAMIGVIPESYRWVTNLIGLEGSISGGLREIRSVLDHPDSDPFTTGLKPIAFVFAAVLEVNLSKNKQAANDLIIRFDNDPVLAKYKECPIIVYAKASVYLKTGKNESALALLGSYHQPASAAHLWFLSFFHGTALLNKLDPAATSEFQLFLANFKGQNYLKTACQKIAWSSLIHGDTAKYSAYMLKIKTLGDKNIDEDKQAYAEAKEGLIPVVPLLKARLLFDGGYYSQATNILLNQKLSEYIKNKRDFAEYNYRFGRIAHETGQTQKAIKYYSQAVSAGRDLPQYYAAGSALQLGLIYENQKKYREADSCYKICLSLDYTEYKTSLNQKAKAGVNRLKKRNP